jgi:hypothetical protein
LPGLQNNLHISPGVVRRVVASGAVNRHGQGCCRRRQKLRIQGLAVRLSILITRIPGLEAEDSVSMSTMFSIQRRILAGKAYFCDLLVWLKAGC